MIASTSKQLNSNIWKFYLYQGLYGLFFSVPVIVLFWQENGLSMTDIMLLQSIYAILVVGLEIPTGYFADVYGRKKALILSSIFIFLAIFVYGFGHNFYHFLVAEVLFAFGSSFSSGTCSAFIFDTLKDLKKEKTYPKVWGNVMFYGLIALAISSVFGGFIAEYELRYALYASVPFFAMLIPLSLTFHEPSRHKRVLEKGYTKKLLKSVYLALLESKKLRWLIVYSGVVYLFIQTGFFLYQPSFVLTGLDVVYFGLVFAGFQVVAALSSKYAHALEKKIGEKFSLVMLIVLVTVSYFLMSNILMLISFAFVFLQQFCRGYKNVVITDYINKLTSSNMRATVLSVENFFSRLVLALFIPLVGVMVDAYSVVQALWVLAFTSLVAGIVILFVLKRGKVI